jgi:hypothetical protein
MSNLASVDSASNTSPIVYKRTILPSMAASRLRSTPKAATSLTLASSCSLFRRRVARSRLFWMLSRRRS